MNEIYLAIEHHIIEERRAMKGWVVADYRCSTVFYLVSIFGVAGAYHYFEENT